jgi:hypothetical protein
MSLHSLDLAALRWLRAVPWGVEVLDIVHRDDVNGDVPRSPESRSSVRDILDFPIAAPVNSGGGVAAVAGGTGSLSTCPFTAKSVTLCVHDIPSPDGVALRSLTRVPSLYSGKTRDAHGRRADVGGILSARASCGRGR